MPEPIDIDLSTATLRLWECGQCKALVMKESSQAHVDWHTKAEI